MHESQSSERRILAHFRDTERPPPSVDELVLKRLRRERQAIIAARAQRRRSLVQVVVVVSVAVVVLVGVSLTQMAHIDGSRAGYALRYALDDSTGTLLRKPEGGRDETNRSDPSTSPTTETMSPQVLPPARSLQSPQDAGFLLLKEARVLIKLGRHGEAIDLLGNCRALIGSDDLAEECDMLEIEAYCGTGQRDIGTAKLAAFKNRWPRSQYARKLRRACK